MPRDGSGNYFLPSGYFVNIGDDVMPSQHNPPLEDLAQSITNSLARSGAGGMLGPLNMGNFPLNNVGSLAGNAVMAAGDLSQAAAGKLVTTSRIWEEAEPLDLGNIAGALALDLSSVLCMAHGVATGNITLGQITNGKPGQTVVLDISQDATGGRTLAYDDDYWLAPAGGLDWDDTAEARNIIVATVLHDGKALVISVTSGGGLE